MIIRSVISSAVVLVFFCAVSMAQTTAPLGPGSGLGPSGGSGAIVSGLTPLVGCGTNGVLFNNGGVVGCGVNFTFDGNATLELGANTYLYAPATATLQFGAAAAASPVAQTVQFQSGLGTNIAGANATIIGSLGTGNAIGGQIIFQTGASGLSGSTQNTPSTGLSIIPNAGGTPIVTLSQNWSFNSGQIYTTANASGPTILEASPTGTAPNLIPNRSDTKAGIGANTAGNVSIIADNAGTATEIIRVSGTDVFLPVLPTSNPGGTVSSVCWGATAGGLWTDTSGTICGISAMMFKTPPSEWEYIAPSDALAGIMSLRTAAWQYKPEYQDHGEAFHVGLIADDVQAMNPLCGVDHDHNYSDRCVEAYLTGAIQALKGANDNLRAEVEVLRSMVVR